MIKIRRASAIAAGAVAALAIGGTAALAAGADDPAPSRSSDDGFSVPMAPDGDPQPTATTGDPAPSNSSSLAAVPPARSALSISIDRAKSIAVRVAGGGQVVKVEEESEHGRAVWEVDVDVRGVRHDIDVDRATGAVIRQRIERAALAGDDDPANHDAGDDHGGNRGSGGGHGSDG
jgi:peptidase YpeB-like protein